MTRVSLLSFFLLATPALADWQTRAGDVPVDPETLMGRTLTFYDDGQSRYSAGGSYSFTYGVQNGGGTAYGVYRVVDDGSICVDFRNGFSRCDLYVMNAGRLLLITQDGARYPVRPD